jgi:glutamate dehydrogenase (NAD(P)+)
MEYHGATARAATQAIEEKISRNTEKVMEISREKNIQPREAAIELASERIKKAMSYRRWSLFSSAPDFI